MNRDELFDLYLLAILEIHRAPEPITLRSLGFVEPEPEVEVVVVVAYVDPDDD